MKTISENKKYTAIELYKLGYSQAKIGEKLGFSEQNVSKILRQSGIETCVGGYNESRSSIKKKHDKIIGLIQKGYSINAIARKMKMSAAGVHYVVSKLSKEDIKY